MLCIAANSPAKLRVSRLSVANAIEEHAENIRKMRAVLDGHAHYDPCAPVAWNTRPIGTPPRES